MEYHRGMLGPTVALPWQFDPLEAVARWPEDRPLAMLHSGRLDARWSRWSVLAEPVGTFCSGADGRATCTGQLPAWTRPLRDHPLHDLRTALVSGGDAPWIGYLGYDLGRWIEVLPHHAVDDRAASVVCLGHCPGYLLHDALTGRWSAGGTWHGGGYPDLPHAPLRNRRFEAGPPTSIVHRGAYEAAVAEALELIGQGDIFQVNLSQRFTAPFSGAAPGATRTLYRRLATVSPAWYGAYLEPGGPTGTAPVIASTSPELFLEMHTDRRVTTRPIKGTRPADVDPSELRHSEKDTAELNMIVDLLRNDLGRVCAYGSVQVEQPRTIESHPTVHHGVATITGRLHPSKDVVHLLRATMPGGSVTGAPKIRAMQIIDALEPVRRGPYCGAIGLLTVQRCHLNVAIRTMAVDPVAQRVDFSVGGGIVADSTPSNEFDETIDKAAAMLAALRHTPAAPTVRPDVLTATTEAMPTRTG